MPKARSWRVGPGALTPLLVMTVAAALTGCGPETGSDAGSDRVDESTTVDGPSSVDGPTAVEESPNPNEELFRCLEDAGVAGSVDDLLADREVDPELKTAFQVCVTMTDFDLDSVPDNQIVVPEAGDPEDAGDDPDGDSESDSDEDSDENSDEDSAEDDADESDESESDEGESDGDSDGDGD